MNSLMMLHRSMMQDYVDTLQENTAKTKPRNRYPGREQERKEIMDFLMARGLDKYARRLRRPKLRLVDNCGSKQGQD